MIYHQIRGFTDTDCPIVWTQCSDANKYISQENWWFACGCPNMMRSSEQPNITLASSVGPAANCVAVVHGAANCWEGGNKRRKMISNSGVRLYYDGSQWLMVVSSLQLTSIADDKDRWSSSMVHASQFCWGTSNKQQHQGYHRQRQFMVDGHHQWLSTWLMLRDFQWRFKMMNNA